MVRFERTYAGSMYVCGAGITGVLHIPLLCVVARAYLFPRRDRIDTSASWCRGSSKLNKIVWRRRDGNHRGCFTDVDVETRYHRSRSMGRLPHPFRHTEAEYNFRQEGLQRGAALDRRDSCCLESDRLEGGSGERL